jgi:murein DD-endopeptidase MepM/ murein hydrolase activator NlpD
LNKRFITLFVLKDDASRTRQFKISTRFFKVLTSASVVLAIVLTFVVIDYARLRVEMPGQRALMEENAGQKVELMGLSANIRELETNLARLNLFDKKLRVIADLNPHTTEESGKNLGVGGSSFDNDTFLPSTGSSVASIVEKMRTDLNDLEAVARYQETSFTELQQYMMKKTSRLASTPSIWPARGWVSSSFGSRISPFTGRPHLHRGIDIANRSGTPIVATGDGIIKKISRSTALGRYVVIRHGHGMETTYGHLKKSLVSVGKRVKRGDRIATMGNTGRSTGPHLHYAVKINGVTVNPVKYILN